MAGVAGLVFVLLFVTGFSFIASSPGGDAPDDELTSFYADEGERLLTIIGGYIIPFAGIAFLWFAAAIRIVFLELPKKRSVVFAPMQFAASILFVAAFFTAAATAVASAAAVEFLDSPEDVNPDVLRMLQQLASAIMFVLGIRMAGMFVITTSNLGRGIMPRWLVVIGALVGVVLLLAISFSVLFVLIFPAWVVLLSGWLLLVPGRGTNVYAG